MNRIFTVKLFILSIFLLSVTAVHANHPADTLRVGFTGIDTENIAEHYFNEIDRRYFRQITRVSGLSGIRVNEDRMKENTMVENTLRPWVTELAQEKDFDYLMGGRLHHISEDESPGFLDGRIYRYDRSSDRFFFLNVRTAFIDLDMELNRFREQFVDTIQPERTKTSSEQFTKWTLIALGSAAVIAGGIILFSNVGASGNGGGPGPGPVN
jgi:hypothetical protein